ncbi:hypothetical protein OG562_42045 [Streptomyces sp. NBC_01275]|uniref:hypothetical protein n=1 Tax=Streptomyces sp. NBC_01275 TaxID=2903807 RepID=UPI00224CC0E1|nr:hypothetical protein [Streptomyces sp. NBC_01275]MCX4767423.1 hypothetical protein [Streptomyces sp. NBC_01275]
MKFRQTVRAAGIVTAGLLGVAAAAAPASAATVNWKVLDPNIGMLCSPAISHVTYPGVHFQGCVVVNANYDAQIVMVVINQGPKAVNIGGWTSSQFGSNVTCADSVLNPNIEVACFGPTVHIPADGVKYDNSVHLTVNGSTKIAPAPSVTHN